MEYGIFVKEESAREIGTSRASMNRTGKTRAAQGVKKHYNEYKDFHQREVEGHICAAFMEMVNMDTMDGMLTGDIKKAKIEPNVNITNSPIPFHIHLGWFFKPLNDFMKLIPVKFKNVMHLYSIFGKQI